MAVLLLAGCHDSGDRLGGRGSSPGQGLPFDTPFDFTDAFYLANGIDPSKLASRVTPSHPSAKAGTSQDQSRNGTRITEAFGGYDAVGSLLYYPLPPGPFRADAFTPDAKGVAARAIGDKFRAFIVPRRNGDPLSSAPANRRQDNIFDTSSGYLTANPLGLWRLTFPRYTDAALNTQPGQQKLAELASRNGLDLDGTPILKRLSEINELEQLGYLELRQRDAGGSQGPPWVV